MVAEGLGSENASDFWLPNGALACENEKLNSVHTQSFSRGDFPSSGTAARSSDTFAQFDFKQMIMKEKYISLLSRAGKLLFLSYYWLLCQLGKIGRV